MMTQQLGFSILTAPLAAIDRRELSQAWYSALHLARDAAPAPEAAAARVLQESTLPRARRDRVPEPAVRRSAVRIANREERTAHRLLSDERERRAPRSMLARRIERCLLRRPGKVRRATFTLDGTSARVHVTLQFATGGLRLIAVCAPPVRERVRQALEEARYALASRGVALAIDLRDTSSC
jgi:hypothetical protein